MQPTHGALSARVSSEQPAEAHTIARQVAAWRACVSADGLTVSAAMPLLDAGSSGATRVRPALERLRAVSAASSVDRLSVPSPDRLARTYASQVVLVDACRRAGVEVLFVHRALGHRPADALRLHVQGRMAEDARAKRIERHRRGKRQAAHVGAVHVRRGAP
jgi:site-specific DNA recombinase